MEQALDGPTVEEVVLLFFLTFFSSQGEPGIGFRGPVGQAGPPGFKVNLSSPLDRISFVFLWVLLSGVLADLSTAGWEAQRWLGCQR